MANYLSLEEAAKKLGIPTQTLIDLRSQGQVRGFRDGTSWKFPENEIDRLKEDLPNLSGLGSGIGGGTGSGSRVGGGPIMREDSALSIGGVMGDDDDAGSSLELGSERSGHGGDSDVNLVPGNAADGSDLLVIPSAGGSGILDLDDLNIAGSAISHNSGELLIDPESGGTKSGVSATGNASGSAPIVARQPVDSASEDSDEFNLGSVLDLEEDIVAGSDQDLDLRLDDHDERASSLEMLGDLAPRGDVSASGVKFTQSPARVSGDVLSELDLLGGDSIGSGLLSGDSVNRMAGPISGLSDTGSGVDDALADDDLMIADDDDDLIISGEGNDISMAGDSGIDLMSPSDSGLSLESEPLDLASSSMSALDLSSELNDGSGSGVGSSGYGSGLIPADDNGSDINFPADEEFQLSPSGIQLDKADESESQEIDVENSDAFGGDFDEPVFEEASAFGGVDAFDDGAAAVDSAGGFDEPADEPVDADDAARAGIPTGAPIGFEIPFTLLQTIGLVLILLVLSLGGMLMTDLIRNMWSYSEPAAPVSSLTDWLIDVAGWGK